MKKILLIDMDKTIANFDKAATESLKKTPGIQFPQCQYKFFENLEPMSGAIGAVQWLSKYYDVVFLTRNSEKNLLSYTEKAVWIQKYFGENCVKNLIICYDKTMVKGDYLIDDNIQEGRYEPEWEHIHFGTEEWHWASIVEFFAKLKEL